MLAVGSVLRQKPVAVELPADCRNVLLAHEAERLVASVPYRETITSPVRSGVTGWEVKLTEELDPVFDV